VTAPVFRRRTAAWLALASMVLNAAWPLLANATPAVQAPPSEICSATGLSHAPGGAPAAPDKGLHASHCTLCPFSAERCAAIPPAVQPLLAGLPAPAPTFARGDSALPAVALLCAAPPRAPPVLS
jgi:DUF2946 family protein